MGRPTALTEELSKKITDYTLAGVHVEVACQAVGIAPSTWYLWKSKGKRDLDRRDEGDYPKIDASHTHEFPKATDEPCWCGHTRYSEFVTSLLVAEAKAEARISAKVQGAFDQDPRLALYFMERRWPKRWARRDRLAISADEEATEAAPTVEVPLDERLAKTLAILGKAGRLPTSDS
ncbi:MAG TPA: hypothetical protein VLA89_07075 [Gemmatimonadales bacterium]|nr:hypothetical protein [Gemmatimonadales bacterium]